MRFHANCILFTVALHSTYAYLNSSMRPEDCGLGELWQEGPECPYDCNDARKILNELRDPPEKTVLLPCQKTLKYGCFCRPTLLRNSSGSCVYPRDCPFTKDNCRPQDETWRTDTTSCPETCQNLLEPNLHWTTRRLQCNVEKFDYCFCNPGLYRDWDGDGGCVSGSQCTKKVCKENEVLAHGINCPPTCATMNDRPQNCYLHRGKKCYCYSGQFRNSAGICVKPEDCEFNSWNYNGKNDKEIIAETCLLEDLTAKLKFVLTTHQRVQKELEVLPSHACNNNETRAERPSCTDTCNDIRAVLRRLHVTDGESDPQVCDLLRKDNCYCDPGFLRNSDDVCVEKKDCPFTQHNCENNEVFIENATACPRTCENPSWPVSVKCYIDKFDSCFCKEGFYRDEDGNGDCVMIEACTNAQLCKKNEVFRHGTSCPMTCATMSSSPRGCCVTKLRKCFCNAGLMKNSRGECVERQDCVNSPMRPEDCGLGELWQEGPECPYDCYDVRKILKELHNPPERTVLLPCQKKMTYGCFCRSKLLRNSSGSCVYVRDCPFTRDNCRPQDETWRTDTTSCPETCENLLKPDLLWATSILQCNVDKFDYCFCNPGLYRDWDGDGGCVLGSQCTKKVCKENEVLAHGINCPPTCATMNDRPENCYLHTGKTCYCYSGQFRNSAGICVKPEDCEFNAESWNYNGENAKKNIEKICTLEDLAAKPKVVLTAHEREQRELLVVPLHACRIDETRAERPSCTDTCNDIRGVLRRLHVTRGESDPQVCDLPRKDNCYCDPGFLRNSDDVCVEIKECPFTQLNCENNEVFSENATACPRTCENPSWPIGVKCHIHKFDSCFCKEGFYRDEDGNGDCVMIEACTYAPLCKENEVFRHGTSCPMTCATMSSRPRGCCITKLRKCFCNAGLMKNSRGECVERQDCDWWTFPEVKTLKISATGDNNYWPTMTSVM